MDRKIGLSSARALANAASPHANQSTGLLACCSKYGLRSAASRFITTLWFFLVVFAIFVVVESRHVEWPSPLRQLDRKARRAADRRRVRRPRGDGHARFA